MPDLPKNQRDIIIRLWLLAAMFFLALLLIRISVPFITKHHMWGSSILWLTLIFTLYLINIFAFASKYYNVYKHDPGKFAFNEDVLKAQAHSFKLSSEQTIADATLTISALKQLEPELARLRETLTEPIKITYDKPDIIETADFKFIYCLPPRPPNRFTPHAMDLHVHTKEDKCIWVFIGHFGQPQPSIRIPELEQQIQELSRDIETLESPTPRVWSYFDFLYFSTITQTTVGYGDILPNSTTVRMLVTSQIIIGMVIVIVIINVALLKTS